VARTYVCDNCGGGPGDRLMLSLAGLHDPEGNQLPVIDLCSEKCFWEWTWNSNPNQNEKYQRDLDQGGE
jgi:hypothetical protein